MSQTAYAPQTQTQAQKSSGGKGCLIGCVVVLILITLVVVCAGIGLYWFVDNQISKFTSDQPMPIQTVELSEEQMADLKARWETFKDAVENDQETEDLVLTADEVNALIQQDENMKGRIFVRIKDGQISGDVSVPTDGIPLMGGRYFNASGTFEVELEDDGDLEVHIVDAEVKGEPVPAEIMDGMRRENLAKDIGQDPNNAKYIEKFESIEVVDDKIILKLRKPSQESTSDSDSEATDTQEDPSEPATTSGETENSENSEETTEENLETATQQ